MSWITRACTSLKVKKTDFTQGLIGNYFLPFNKVSSKHYFSIFLFRNYSVDRTHTSAEKTEKDSDIHILCKQKTTRLTNSPHKPFHDFGELKRLL